MQDRKENSEFIGVVEAAMMLGMSKGCIRQWIYDGRIPSVKSPGGPSGTKILIRRADILALMEKIKGQGGDATHVLKVVRKINGFEVPDGFDAITEYHELRMYTEAFAAKNIGFLLMVGSPGGGKSEQMKLDLLGKPHLWIDNQVTNLGLYCGVYKANGAPVTLDDINHFLEGNRATSLVKSLTQTRATDKGVSWESPMMFKLLEREGVPTSYKHSSPICLIGNEWDPKNANMYAIQDRALRVAFFPTIEAIHKRTDELRRMGVWVVDDDVYNFIGNNFDKIPHPSMREYYNGMLYKKITPDWRVKMLKIWSQQRQKI